MVWMKKAASKKQQSSTTLMDVKSDQNLLQRTVLFPNGDKYTGEWLDNKKHGEQHTPALTPSHLILTSSEKGLNLFKGGGLRFGKNLVPFTAESGNTGNLMDTVPTACCSQKQKCMQRSTVATGKMAKSTYVTYLISRARIRRCLPDFILF